MGPRGLGSGTGPQGAGEPLQLGLGTGEAGRTPGRCWVDVRVAACHWPVTAGLGCLGAEASGGVPDPEDKAEGRFTLTLCFRAAWELEGSGLGSFFALKGRRLRWWRACMHFGGVETFSL